MNAGSAAITHLSPANREIPALLGITWIRDILQGNHAPLTTRGKRFKGQVLALMCPRLGQQRLGWHRTSQLGTTIPLQRFIDQ